MSLQVFILGILSEGNHHPYDIKKMFKRENMEDIHKITDGTLYYNFEALLKKGCIEKVEVTREDNRPEKTTYAITKKGKETLEQEIYGSFKNFKDIKSLYSPTLFLKHADPVKLAFLIEEGIENLKGKITRNKEEWDLLKDKTPPHVHLIQDYALSQLELDMGWLQKLLVYVQDKTKSMNNS